MLSLKEKGKIHFCFMFDLKQTIDKNVQVNIYF